MPSINYSSLSPQPVWQHFQTLCNIPRPSKHEQQLRDHLKNWAEKQGLTTYVDQIGNLIIRKAATKGRTSEQGIILQAHIDMVTQANSNTPHDFMKDPIHTIIEDGWLIAPNTTLGADNGIGVALALAVLEAQDISHGPIEVLLTVDEEAGMSGARCLEKNILTGKWLFNIDTEEWGELYLGCAGSQDIEIQHALNYMPVPHCHTAFEIQILGLKGGHSGVDIHLGRGNANVILADYLHQVLNQFEGHLIELTGGTARNALPREAVATFTIPDQHIDAFILKTQEIEHTYLKQLTGIDDLLKFQLKPRLDTINQVLEHTQQNAILTAISTCPYGISKMSESLTDIVETSNNIGVIRIDQSGFTASIMVRSLINQHTQNLAKQIKQHFAFYQISSELAPFVSGWAPNPDSQPLKCLQLAYIKAFDIDPTLKVIHAGLECGIIAEHYPDLQMVSFGPDIRGAHAPGERVNIESVAKCWTLLVTALAQTNIQ